MVLGFWSRDEDLWVKLVVDEEGAIFWEYGSWEAWGCNGVCSMAREEQVVEGMQRAFEERDREREDKAASALPLSLPQPCPWICLMQARSHRVPRSRSYQ